MRKEELWDHITRTNSGMLTVGINLTAKGIRKFFNLVFDKAHSQGFKNGRAYEVLHPSVAQEANRSPKPSLFDEVFGPMGRTK